MDIWIESKTSLIKTEEKEVYYGILTTGLV